MVLTDTIYICMVTGLLFEEYLKMSKCLIIISPYYKKVADLLKSGAVKVLESENIKYDLIEVPGALEIPLATKLAIESDKYDMYIALGCVIRGETSHYDIVCNESARGLSTLSLAHNAPIGNGILTCDTMDQALVRADPSKKNKGADVANAAISLYKLKAKM